MLYSFRDLVALRTIVYLRSDISLQKIRRAYTNLDALDFTEHPSEYRFATDGKTIVVATSAADTPVDILEAPGQQSMFTLSEVFGPFENKQGDKVVDFLNPRPNLTVRAGRAGGVPTAAKTRVTYSVIARAIAGVTVTAETIGKFYPKVTREAALDAVSFNEQVLAA
jgi:uncharacterized protein (DUF433 family)